MDRKTLIREYKESRGPMGVYQVRNQDTGQWLIGTSTDLPSVLNRHRAQLRLGVHRNGALQKDWTELGADSFAFEILDTLEPPDAPDYDPSEDLRALEELWLERLRAGESPGYPVR